MKIEIDTHTHTTASGHAYSSMREMARAAKEAGLKGIAITDHAPAMPGGPHLFHFMNLKVVPREMEGVRILCGVELNIMNENGEIDMADEVLKRLDIRIASMHSPCFMAERPKDITMEAVTHAYEKAMKNPNIDIIGHPDDSKFPIDYKRLVRAAVKTGTLLEINNSSLSPVSFREGANQNVETLLKLCKEEGAKVVVSTDSHIDVCVGVFDYALEKLGQADFPEELVANANFDTFVSSLR